MAGYSIGIDFGTLSGRALLMDAGTGETLASCERLYPHGVMDEALPGGKRLGMDWALQHPRDYLDVLEHAIPAVLREGGVSPTEIIGIGVDFTACTVLPVKQDGTPLCFLPEYEREPHAYVKLWKHHAAQPYATRLNEIAAARGEAWFGNYGNAVSSEWAIPKLWQILDEAPEIYQATDRFIEGADWIVWQLTGREIRSSCTAGYKELWNKRLGFPSDDFFAALDPRLRHVVDEKFSRTITPVGQRAGRLTGEMAALTGLQEGTPVAVGVIDAHVCVPAVGIDGPGKMLAIMGTSTCHMIMGQEEKQLEGVCGVVEDGILPGFYGYEAGQSCVGDHFAWVVENCIPAAYEQQAKARGINLHQLLREKAQGKAPGESGLIALDWFNGNRSVLMDADLSGLLLGLTLQTRPEDIYRALIEATAFGTRMIIETFRTGGVPVEEFYASGGISQKDPMTMQIYSDIIRMPVRIAGSEQAGAYGAAMFGAVAAGAAAGGYANIFDAARKLGRVKDIVYWPDEERASLYDRLYAEYKRLHDDFGRGKNNVMKRLKAIRKMQMEGRQDG